VVAACAEKREEDVGDRAAAAYARKSGLEPRVFPCRAAEGAGPID
jgi:hypothetical protein